jgi:hypothetical protein
MSGRAAAVGTRRRGGRKSERLRLLPKEWSELGRRRFRQFCGVALVALALAALVALLTYHRSDPSGDHATAAAAKNLLGRPGAFAANFIWQWLGLGALLPPAVALLWGVRLAATEMPPVSPWRLLALPVLVIFAVVALAAAFPLNPWPVEAGMGGISGRLLLGAAGDIVREAEWSAPRWTIAASEESLQANARLLESVLEDYGVRGRIVGSAPARWSRSTSSSRRPAPRPARVIGLADDIARSMSAVSVRVAVVPGRNVIGIELPNARRETVLSARTARDEDLEKRGGRCRCARQGHRRRPGDRRPRAHAASADRRHHRLGQVGGINTMILSLLYRLRPDECRFIMIDPKMLELSVYDGIPHLLAPVVTEPRRRSWR